MSPPPVASPASHRSVTDPNQVPQLKDMQQQGNGNDVMQDLFNRLSMSQKKPSAAQMMDPNAFSRIQPGNGNGGHPNAPRSSTPFVQHYQQSPNNRRRTPGRQPHQPRPDSNQTRGNMPGPGKTAANGPPASAAKPLTSMMSFVPSSVAAKQRKTSAPAATASPMKTSTPSDTLSLEQDLKRLLNLNPAGESSVR